MLIPWMASAGGHHPTIASRSALQNTAALLRWALCCVLACAMLAVPVSRPARADEFATVAAGDPLYGHLATVTQAGWRGAPQGASGALTRYEMALETAKSLSTVTARQQADHAWASSAPKAAVRALRELTGAFQEELKSLGVDVGASLRLCETLLQAPAPSPLPRARTTATGSATTASSPISIPAPSPAATGTSRVPAPRTSGPSTGASQRQRDAQQRDAQQELWIPMSQRLRINTVLSVLTREAEDPFGDAALGIKRAPIGGTPRNGSPASTVKAGLSLGLTNWLTLRADYGRRVPAAQPLSLQELSLQESSLPRTGQMRTLSGGVDVTVRPGVMLSGNVENIASGLGGAAGLTGLAAAAAPRRHWTRFEGGVKLSAWQNRLSLKANMSRLVPEDARILPSTVGGLNVGLSVTERLSLTLLYQQMFGASGAARADRLVAGGINIDF